MIGGSLSRRYAKALFQLALEGEREEEIGQEIGRFLAAYTHSPLITVLGNPAFAQGSRKNILLQVAQHLGLSSTAVHFLSLLLERDRLAFLTAIADRYHRLLDESKGRVEAQVSAASPLEQGVLERLRAALGRISGKEVVLREQTDPGLIGGLVLQLEGKIYDGSARTQLEKMKQRIEKGY